MARLTQERVRDALIRAGFEDPADRCACGGDRGSGRHMDALECLRQMRAQGRDCANRSEHHRFRSALAVLTDELERAR